MILLILLLLTLSVKSLYGKGVKPKKVAIMGGGTASCTAALTLTDQPGWKERYDITIYQLGWRLGGKARSGRNKDYGQRSEGITGYDFPASYLETKRLMQSVYNELKRPEGAPLRTFEEAFKSKPFWAGTGTDCEVDTKCFSADYLFKKLTETFLWMTEKMIKDLKIDYKIKKEHFNSNSFFLKSNEPKYKEIINQEAYLLQQHNIDLESFWTNWTRVYEESFKRPIPEVILRRGKDFDIIVYGISVGSLASLCPELLDKSPRLKAANEHIGRVPSFNLQFCGTTDLEYDPKKSFNFRILDARQRKSYLTFYYDDILKSEDWKAQGLEPNHLLYIVYMPDISHFEIPPRNNTSFPKEMTEEMKGLYMQTLPEVLRSMGSNSFQDGVFNWTVLADPENRAGVERFDSQYVILNFNPSDHYTQVLTNTSQYRITTDGAGFDNIYFTGDWIQNGINYGSIEAAITSGLLTSKAISGYPETIYSEQFIPKKKRRKKTSLQNYVPTFNFEETF